MLKLAALRQSRGLALAAALALVSALPGAGLIHAAHAAPAIPPTTVSATISGPNGSAAGATATYVVSVKNDPLGQTAINAVARFAMANEYGSVLSYSAPGATCGVVPLLDFAVITCTVPTLAAGAELDMTVQVMFSGKTGTDTLSGRGWADNAPDAVAKQKVTVVAQSDFGGQAPGPMYPGTHGFGGGNG